MAHELEKYDDMFSVRERPWHGLGKILLDHPTVEEAANESGLIWDAEIKPAFYEKESGEFIRIPGSNAVIRTDQDIVIGAVGNRYEIYQNSEMWSFIETFQDQTKCQLETAGSLKNGATTWVLAKNGVVEYLKGDPVEEYFLFRNSFNGTSPIMILFTNIRVVCANTLNAALRNAKNIFKVRHTANASDQLEEVQKALGIRANYQDKVADAMDILIRKQLSDFQMADILGNVIFPEPKKIIQEGGKVVKIEEASKKAHTVRKNKIEAVTKLIESGAGSDITGVKGSAYGLYQALTEWADHEKSIKLSKGRDRKEVKFENAFWGTGSDFKQDCFNELIKIAA